MPVTIDDIDKFAPGCGRPRDRWVNWLLKQLVADIAASGGNSPGQVVPSNMDGGDASAVLVSDFVVDGGGA